MKKLSLLSFAFLTLILAFAGCDQRQPLQYTMPPIIRIECDSTIKSDTTVLNMDTVYAFLTNAENGAVESGAVIHFSAIKGFITPGIAPINMGLGIGLYHPLNTGETYFDTLSAYYVYNGTSDTVRTKRVIKVLVGPSTEFSDSPILEMNVADSIMTYTDALIVPITAILYKADHSLVPDGYIVYFSTKIGVVTGPVIINKGSAKASYFPRKSTTEYTDTIFVRYYYNNDQDTVIAAKTIRILPGTVNTSDEVGSIYLHTGNPSVAIKGSGAVEFARIIATVKDVYGSKVNDGMKVKFKILSGPGGGEYIDSVGWIEDTASTRNGDAEVTFNSGLKLGVVEIMAEAGNKVPPVSTQSRLLTITAGPPYYITIDALENSVLREGAGWKMYIEAMLTDIYHNPVKDSTNVTFTIDPDYSFIRDSVIKQVDLSKIAIQNHALTEVKICSTCDSTPGVAVTYITFPSEMIFDSLKLIVETSVNGQKISGTRAIGMPLPNIPMIITAQNITPSYIFVPTNGKDTAIIEGRLTDTDNFPIKGAVLSCATENGSVFCPLGTPGRTGRTDSDGKVTFYIIFDKNAKADPNKPVQGNAVQITCPYRTIEAGKVSFNVAFQ